MGALSAKKGGIAMPCQVSPQEDSHAGFQLFYHNVLLHYQHHISINWRPILPCYISGLSHSVQCPLFTINSGQDKKIACRPLSTIVSDLNLGALCRMPIIVSQWMVVIVLAGCSFRPNSSLALKQHSLVKLEMNVANSKFLRSKVPSTQQLGNILSVQYTQSTPKNRPKKQPQNT